MSKAKATKIIKKSKDLMESVDRHTYWMMLTIFRNPISLTEIRCDEYTTTSKKIDHLNEKQMQSKALTEYKTQIEKEYPHNIIAVHLFKTKEECNQATKEEKQKFNLPAR